MNVNFNSPSHAQAGKQAKNMSFKAFKIHVPVGGRDGTHLQNLEHKLPPGSVKRVDVEKSDRPYTLPYSVQLVDKDRENKIKERIEEKLPHWEPEQIEDPDLFLGY